MQTLITLDHVTFRYPPIGNAQNAGGMAPVLDDISLQIQEGEFIAVLGANGSGKSTLARHLNGLLLPETGILRVADMDTRTRAKLGAIRQTVGMVFQHPEDQVVSSTVEEDVAFGPENLGLEPARIRRRVDEAIAAVGLEAHRLRPPHLLSAGQMQRLALAGVLAMRPKCVVFDEATTMLDPAGRRMVFALMDRLRAEGLTVIFITHNMEEAARASRVLILDQGRLVFDGPPQEAFSSAGLVKWGLEITPAMELARCLGIDALCLSLDDLMAALPAWKGSGPKNGVRSVAEETSRTALIDVSGLEHIYMRDTPLAHMALEDIRMTAVSGRAMGLAGVTGSGKSTLLQHLNGLLRPQRGHVRVGSFVMEDENTRTLDVVKTVGLVFQNPENQFFETYAGDEIAFGPRRLALDGRLRERVRAAMEAVGLDFDQFKDRPTFTMSGGEQRKAALASVLAIQPQILLLDEPTAGLDPRSHQEILASLRQLEQGGVEIVISSHRMEDLAELTQDLTVFRKGRSLMNGPTEGLFSDFERLADAGLEPPAAASVARRLRELGWPLPDGIITPARLESAFQSLGGIVP